MSKIDWAKANNIQLDPARVTVEKDYGILPDKAARRKGDTYKLITKGEKSKPKTSQRKRKRIAKKLKSNDNNNLKYIPTPRKSAHKIYENLNRHIANVEVKVKTKRRKLISTIRGETQYNDQDTIKSRRLKD